MGAEVAVATETDRQHMRQALALAALGEGATWPNPRVGCVVVRDGKVVGRGYHVAAGQAHAESMAIDEAGDAADGSTLYVNLEPCAHRGKTPPCDQRLIRSGVKRVVAALRDPNPIVDGRGFENLRRAGIDVNVGMLSEEAESLNAAFLHWHRTGRPLVTLKAGLSSDGRLTASDGVSKWITGTAARRFAHRLRWRSNAILVGAETARRDDPRLSVRLEGLVAKRRRIVLKGERELPAGLNLFSVDDPARVYVSNDSDCALPAHVDVIRVTPGDGGPNLIEVLEDLGGLGVQSLLVEGGGRIHGAFLAGGLADRAALFVSPKLIGSIGSTGLLETEAASAPGVAWRIAVEKTIPLESDLFIDGRIVAA